MCLLRAIAHDTETLHLFALVGFPDTDAAGLNSASEIALPESEDRRLRWRITPRMIEGYSSLATHNQPSFEPVLPQGQSRFASYNWSEELGRPCL